MKKALTLVLALLLCLSALPGMASGSDSIKLTIWIPKGEDSVYYSDYSLNPAMQYLQTLTWEGGVKISMEFFVPISGEEKNSFNTYLSTGEYCGMMNLAYSD